MVPPEFDARLSALHPRGACNGAYRYRILSASMIWAVWLTGGFGLACGRGFQPVALYSLVHSLGATRPGQRLLLFACKVYNKSIPQPVKVPGH